MSFFKLSVLIGCVVVALIGIILFATGSVGVGGDGRPVGNVEVWGTVDEDVMRDVFDAASAESGTNFDSVSYIEKDADVFDRDLTEALAAGRGPDLFLLRHDSIVQHADKVYRVLYENFSERDFRNTFIEQGELYLTDEGILGFPFIIDPLVMYWNRTMFSSAAVPETPEYWDELFSIAERMSERDEAGNITKSAVALGEYRNVDQADAVLSTLIMQAGNDIAVSTRDGGSQITLGERGTAPTVPAEAALRLFTEFSDPVKDIYSWNRSLPRSRQAFLAGDLGIYFGFASELQGIRRANPNLNFDIAHMLQSRDADANVTFANMQALAIPKGSDNKEGAFRVAALLSGQAGAAEIAEQLVLPPVRRGLLAGTPSDAFLTIFYDSALWARGWLEPDPEAVDTIFREMVENVTSGALSIRNAVIGADTRLRNAI